MAFPNEAGILALRGKRCLDSQYFRGHSSKRFQEEGDNWCEIGILSIFFSTRLITRCYARDDIRINTIGRLLSNNDVAT